MTHQEAYRIAFVAHGACGQTRADGVTPYIAHPCRVAELTEIFSRRLEYFAGPRITAERLNDRLVASYLHDVLEDTKLRAQDLVLLGVTVHQLDIIERLTKPDAGPSPASYYARIAESPDALVVKASDRAANLESALAELIVPEPSEPRRWERYIEKTRTDVLPLYDALPVLREQLEWRLAKIDEALPVALEKRAVVVARERAKAGVA